MNTIDTDSFADFHALYLSNLNKELASFRSLGRAFAYIDAVSAARDCADSVADEGRELAGFVSVAKGGF
jgi:hypothetical protein